MENSEDRIDIPAEAETEEEKAPDLPEVPAEKKAPDLPEVPAEEKEETKDPLVEMAEKIRSQAPQGIRLTPLGEKMVWKKEGGLVEDENLYIIHYNGEKPLNATLHDLMCTLYTAAQYIIKSGRQIPITRNELIQPQKDGGCTQWGYKKGDVQKLEKLDLVKVGHTYLSEKKTQKKVGARVVVYPTALGRGYIQKFVDKEFMVDNKEFMVDDKVQ